MAAHSLNYAGTFVYQHQGRLEAMHVVHAMDAEGEREPLDHRIVPAQSFFYLINNFFRF